MTTKLVIGMAAALVLSNAALGQVAWHHELAPSKQRESGLVVLQKDKKAGLTMVALGVLFLTMYKAPVGHGAGGSGFGEGDPAPVFLGAGLIVLGFDGSPRQPSWMPEIAFVRRTPTFRWTVSRW